jgi:N-acetyl-anhydromuramyl-L-alanine amidase AmpD
MPLYEPEVICETSAAAADPDPARRRGAPYRPGISTGLQYEDLYHLDFFQSEREGYDIRYLVMHDTEGPTEAAISWWTNPDNPYRSSAHDLIDKKGVVWRCVPYEKAAHHVGYSHVPGFNEYSAEADAWIPNANLPTIGIELEYPRWPESPPYPGVQLQSAVEHARSLVTQYGITRDRIFRHADIDTNGKTDPRNFEWDWFLDQVFSEVEYMLDETARHAAWNSGGIPYNPEAAFAKYARLHDLGKPETTEFDFTFQGREYRGQGFSKAITYCEVGQWNDIKELTW